MKIVALLICFISSTAFSTEVITCQNGHIQMSIISNRDAKPGTVSWSLKLLNDSTFSKEGSGAWQKEIDSEDAFSSFDDQSAISYKNKKSIFVLPNGEVIYFRNCELEKRMKNSFLFQK